MKYKRNFCLLLVYIFIAIFIVSFSANVLAQEKFDQQAFLKALEGLAIKKDGTPLKVGITAADFANPWSIITATYPSWILKQAGAEVIGVFNANYDLNAQQNTMDDYVVAGADIIIVQPVDDYAIADKIREIQAKGVEVICWNHVAMSKDNVPLVRVAGISPNEAMVTNCAEYIAEKAQGREVKIAQIIGDLGTIIAQERDKKFKDAIAKYPNIKYVNQRVTDWGPEGALAATQDFLSADPDLFAIQVQSDGMLSGVFTAMKSMGRLYPVGDPKHIIVTCVDGFPAAHEQLREMVTGVLDVTQEQSPYAIACIPIKAALMYAQGIPLPDSKDGVIAIKPVPITNANINDPYLWGNYGVKTEEVWPRTLEIWKQYRWAGDEAILNRFK